MWATRIQFKVALAGDDEWQGTLRDVSRALVPGGRLVFDSRDPGARHWERWNPHDSRRWISHAVESAGMHAQQIYGGWDREPVPAADGELVVHGQHWSE